MKKISFLIPFFLVFYLFLFFNFNNKTLLLILISSCFILYQKLKDIKLVFWILYLLVLPFEKGKGFSFTLLPTYMTHQGEPYNYWFTITFTDLTFFFLVYFIIRENIINNWKKSKIKIKQQDLLVFIFLLISYLTVYISQFQIVSFLAFLRLARMILAYFLIRKILQNKKVFKITVLTLTSSLFFQGCWAILQFIRQGLLGRDLEQIGELFSPFGHLAAEDAALFRASGTFVHPNLLAAFLGVLLPFVLVQYFNKDFNPLERKFISLAFLSGSIGLLFTASRAAWVVVFLILSLTSIFLHLKMKVDFSVFFRSTVSRMLLAIVIISFPFLILPRMVSIFQAFEKYGSAYYRMDLLTKAVQLSLRNPQGVGLAVFPAVFVYEFGKFFTYPAPVHNLFLQILVSLGILGLTSFLIIILLTYKQFFLKLSNKQLLFLKTSAFFASLSFLGLANFHPLFLVPNLTEYFWLFLGILTL